MTTMDDHRDLLNAIVETIHGIHKDIVALRETVDIILATQTSHGKALGDLQLEFERSHRPRDTASEPPKLTKLNGGGE